MISKPKNSASTNNFLVRYAGLGMQLLVLLALAVWAGYKMDRWMKIPLPLFVWLLPFIALCMMIYKLIKETSKKKDDEK